MPSYNESSKIAIYKWRETHHNEYNEYNKKCCLAYYNKNKDKCNAKRLQLYYYQKECKIFRNILLLDI